jgi:hypothetical protein
LNKISIANISSLQALTVHQTSAVDDKVSMAVDHDVAIITINNPPVNAFSPAVSQGTIRKLLASTLFLTGT